MPETGIAWYDPSKKNLEIVVGVQSPGESAESLAYLLGAAKGTMKPATISRASSRAAIPVATRVAVRHGRTSSVWARG